MRVAGFGFRKEAGTENLAAAFEATGCGPVEAIASVEEKADAAAFRELSALLGIPVVAISARAVPSVATLTCSRASLKRFGTGSLAEAAALIAAGNGARLLAPRVVSPCGMATCAIAEGEGP